MKLSFPTRFLSIVLVTLALCGVTMGARAETAAANTAPAGEYRLDPYHASLQFRINHLGLSNYVARFTRFDATLQWNPADPAASSISLTVEPASIRTDFSGDYKAGHKDSPWSSFEESLSRDPKFFNTDKFAKASFESTRVEPTGPGRWRVTGDLTLIGQTRPVVLEAALVGETAKHIGTGQPALGLTASGKFRRSEFGMDYLIQPPLLGDEIGIQFEGEFAKTP